jgi:hypothetical protein
MVILRVTFLEKKTMKPKVSFRKRQLSQEKTMRVVLKNLIVKLNAVNTLVFSFYIV